MSSAQCEWCDLPRWHSGPHASARVRADFAAPQPAPAASGDGELALLREIEAVVRAENMHDRGGGTRNMRDVLARLDAARGGNAK